MENLLIETAKQVPALTVLTVIVWKLTTLFLTMLRDAQTGFLASAAQSRQEFLASLRQQQSENLEAHKSTQSVVKENTLVQVKINESLVKLTDAVDTLCDETRANTEKLRGK